MVCINCKYFDVCGDVDRTEPCEGRVEVDVPACAENCPYNTECPHAMGIHYNAWGEGIECMRAGEIEDLPW